MSKSSSRLNDGISGERFRPFPAPFMEITMPVQQQPAGRRVVFQFLVPVHVEVEDGCVTCVTVIDETPVSDPTVVEGDPAYLAAAVAASDDGQAWPSWRFGY